jgi:hypothetical protein
LYEDGRLDNKFFHLLKNLYGANSAPLMFHNLLHNWFISEGFLTNPHDPCLYYKWVDGVPVFALAHVDDCTIVTTPELMRDLNSHIKTVFNIKELGELGLNADGSPTLLLGMEVRRTADEFQFRQHGLIDQLVSKLGNELSSIPHEKVPMRDIRLSSTSSPTTPIEKARWKARNYRSHVGVIGYLMLATLPQLAFSYKELSRFNDTYGQEHWDALLRVVAYLKKNRESLYLSLSRFGGMLLSGYCDSDWNGSDVCISSTGYITFLGFSPLSWSSRLQRCTARSTGEAEFIALSAISQECVYLKMLLASLRYPQSTLEIYCNDSSRFLAEAKVDRKHLYRTAYEIWNESSTRLTSGLILELPLLKQRSPSIGLPISYVILSLHIFSSRAMFERQHFGFNR